MTDSDQSCILITGYLKQQSVDSTGLYAWIRKKFTLQRNNNGSVVLVEILLHGDIDFDAVAVDKTNIDKEPRVSVPLSSIKYAKPWNIIGANYSPLGGIGFGFDLLWTSGRLCSFLADNEIDCKAWVGTINTLLPQQLYMSPASLTSVSADTATNSSAATTTATNATFTSTAQANWLPATKSSPSPSPRSNIRLRNQPTVSAHQHNMCNDQATASTADKSVTDSRMQITSLPNMSMNSMQIPSACSKSVKNTADAHVQITTVSSNPADTTTDSRAQIPTASSTSLNNTTDVCAQTPTVSNKPAKTTTDSRVQVATISSNQASATTETRVQIPTAFNKLLNNTKDSRAQFAGPLHHRDIYSGSYTASSKPDVEIHASAPGASTTPIAGLTVAADSTAGTAALTLASSQQTERELSQLRAQVQAMRMELVAAHQKEYTAASPVNSHRNTDKQVAFFEHELASLRQTFAERERATAADLTRLEELHERKVKSMAQALLTERQENDRVRAALEESRLIAVELERKLARVAAEHAEQLKAYAVAAREGQKQLVDALGREREAWSREERFRAQLTEQLESNRLLRAECEELLRQAEGSRTEVLQLRSGSGGEQVKDSSPSLRLGDCAREASLQIAKAEAALLERETHRLTAANLDLSQSLSKYERVLYGRSKERSQSRAVSGSSNTKKYTADSLPGCRSQSVARFRNLGKPTNGVGNNTVRVAEPRMTKPATSVLPERRSLPCTFPVASKRRSGCCRSSERFGASAERVLSKGKAAVPQVTASESPNARSVSQLSNSLVATETEQGTFRRLSMGPCAGIPSVT